MNSRASFIIDCFQFLYNCRTLFTTLMNVECVTFMSKNTILTNVSIFWLFNDVVYCLLHFIFNSTKTFSFDFFWMLMSCEFSITRVVNVEFCELILKRFDWNAICELFIWVARRFLDLLFNCYVKFDRFVNVEEWSRVFVRFANFLKFIFVALNWFEIVFEVFSTNCCELDVVLNWVEIVFSMILKRVARVFIFCATSLKRFANFFVDFEKEFKSFIKTFFDVENVQLILWCFDRLEKSFRAFFVCFMRHRKSIQIICRFFRRLQSWLSIIDEWPIEFFERCIEIDFDKHDKLNNRFFLSFSNLILIESFFEMWIEYFAKIHQ